jgi:hypothetical protein
MSGMLGLDCKTYAVLEDPTGTTARHDESVFRKFCFMSLKDTDGVQLKYEYALSSNS